MQLISFIKSIIHYNAYYTAIDRNFIKSLLNFSYLKEYRKVVIIESRNVLIYSCTYLLK